MPPRRPSRIKIDQSALAVSRSGVILGLGYTRDLRTVPQVIRLLRSGEVTGVTFVGVLLEGSQGAKALAQFEDASAEIAATSLVGQGRPGRGQRRPALAGLSLVPAAFFRSGTFFLGRPHGGGSASCSSSGTDPGRKPGTFKRSLGVTPNRSASGSPAAWARAGTAETVTGRTTEERSVTITPEVTIACPSFEARSATTMASLVSGTLLPSANRTKAGRCRRRRAR